MKLLMKIVIGGTMGAFSGESVEDLGEDLIEGCDALSQQEVLSFESYFD